MPRFLKAYHYALMFYIGFVYFSNIPGYLSQPGYSSYISIIPTVIYGDYFTAFVLASLFIFIVLETAKSVATSKVLAWSVGYLIVTLIWYVFARGDREALDLRLWGISHLLAFVALCSGDDKVRAFARWAILFAVLLAVANNIYDFLNPYYFTPRFDPYSNPGRAAGFYINANRAGGALLVGTVLTATMIPATPRLLYVLLVGIGVLLTFSRTAILAWGILIALLVLQRQLTVWKLALGVAGLVIVLSVAVPAMSYFESLGSDSRSNIEGRIEWLTQMGQAADDEAIDERRALSSRAIELILEKPLLGNGVGATTAWAERTASHNMYLMGMAEYGIPIGIMILPLLVLASTWAARGEAQEIAVCFGAMVLFFGFFSHNILDEDHFLLGFALMGSMAYRSSLQPHHLSAHSRIPDTPSITNHEPRTRLGGLVGGAVAPTSRFGLVKSSERSFRA